MIVLALFAGLAAVLALFVCGISYARRMDAGRTRDQQLNAVAVAVYRHEMGLAADPEAAIPAATDLDDLDAKWSAYWANSRAQDNALRADLNDYVGWAANLEHSFALDCDRIVKDFAIAAVSRQAETASAWGGWRNDVDRRADLIVASVGGSLATLNHDLRVEAAECTATGSWNEQTERELKEMLNEGASA